MKLLLMDFNAEISWRPKTGYMCHTIQCKHQYFVETLEILLLFCRQKIKKAIQRTS